MAQKGIREYDAKRLLAGALEGTTAVEDRLVLVTPETDLKALPDAHPWLREARLVCKPDQLFGKRGKNNLLYVDHSFDEVAAWIAERMNVETTIEGAFSETAFFALAPLNEAVWELGPDAREGAWTGPIDLGNATFWIQYVESRRESRSLYEAQLTIFREITEERRAEERRSYLNSLMERARVSSREEILLRLFYLAQRLYGPSGR